MIAPSASFFFIRPKKKCSSGLRHHVTSSILVLTSYVTWVPYHHTAVNRDVTHTSEPYFSSRMCICSATSPDPYCDHIEHMSDSFLSACSVRASDLQKICADSNQAATAPPLARQASTVFRELGGSIVSLLLLSSTFRAYFSLLLLLLLGSALRLTCRVSRLATRPIGGSSAVAAAASSNGVCAIRMICDYTRLA